ncbi:MAG: hypothetical protein QNJ40_03270 [Xanthomonadales bacterium]|nr:hypothetical protein [Xanthomonadales bacterium]
MSWKSFPVALALFIAAPGLAEQAEPPDPAAEPRQKLEALGPLAGTWRLAMERNAADGWQPVGEAHLTIEPAFNALKWVATVRPGPDVDQEVVIMSFYYHQHWDRYMVTTIDQTYGALAVEVGDLVDGDLVVDNTGGPPTFPTPDGRRLHFRTTFFDVTTEPRGWLIETSADGGSNWSESFRISITRL